MRATPFQVQAAGLSHSETWIFKIISTYIQHTTIYFQMRAYYQVNLKTIWNKKLQIGIKYMVEIRLKILDKSFPLLPLLQICHIKYDFGVYKSVLLSPFYKQLYCKNFVEVCSQTSGRVGYRYCTQFGQFCVYE